MYGPNGPQLNGPTLGALEERDERHERAVGHHFHLRCLPIEHNLNLSEGLVGDLRGIRITSSSRMVFTSIASVRPPQQRWAKMPAAKYETSIFGDRIKCLAK